MGSFYTYCEKKIPRIVKNSYKFLFIRARFVPDSCMFSMYYLFVTDF